MTDAVHFDEIGSAADAVREHILANQASFPEHIRDRLVGLTRTGTSPVDMVVGYTDAVYANRDSMDETSRAIAIGTADLIGAKGYHQALDGRAFSVSSALSRDLGLEPVPGSEWPSADDDPAADDTWLPAEEEEPTE